MKTLFPPYIVLPSLLLVVQTYLLICITLPLLRRIKLLKKPYAGMDYAETLLATILLLGVLFISSADATGLFQAARTYDNPQELIEKTTLQFFARSFLVILLMSTLFIGLNYLNMRLWFRDYYKSPGLPLSMLLSAIAVALALTGWFTCKEVIDGITPKLINLQ